MLSGSFIFSPKLGCLELETIECEVGSGGEIVIMATSAAKTIVGRTFEWRNFGLKLIFNAELRGQFVKISYSLAVS